MSANNKQFDCNDHRAASFVTGSMPAQDLADFEQHLCECLSCRQQVQSQTADDSEWQQVGQYLQDDDSDMDFLSSLSADPIVLEEAADLGASRMAAQQAIALLDATDDPHMLGRIGSYEVSGLIGSGGMGVVFKGFDRSLNRFVAIKVLSPHLATIGSARRRFAREAQAVAAVVHDNVVEIYGVSEEHDPPFLVMPYVKGMSLQKRIADLGPLQLAEILRIGMQTASGLAAAHVQGLVHRDIKPANILLPDGVERVRITDFGLARAADDASLTRSGVIAGTPQYMSPEQARSDAVDHRSDLFSLGSVIYMMCTGRAPFRAETSYGVLRRITDTQARPIREINPAIPEWLCSIVERLHAKAVDDRYESAAEVSGLLGERLNHVQTPDHPLPIVLAKMRPRTVVGKRLTYIAMTAFLLLIAVGTAWRFLPLPGDQTTSTEDETPIIAYVPEIPTEEVSSESDVDWHDGIDLMLWDLAAETNRLDTATELQDESDELLIED